MAHLVLVECSWNTLDDLLLFNASANFGPRVVKMLRTDDGDEDGNTGGEIESWLTTNGSGLLSKEEGEKDDSAHWNMRHFVARQAKGLGEARGRKEICKLVAMEGLLILYRVTNYCGGNRKLLELAMTEQGVSFATVKTEKEEGDDSQQKKRKHEKKRKEKKKKMMFLGWKFPPIVSTTSSSPNKKRKERTEDHGMVYGVTDVGGYLGNLVIYEMLRWFYERM